MGAESSQADQVRQRFTKTAEAFTSAARGKRGEEADHLADCVLEGFPNAESATAVDIACGPGTFTRPLAARIPRGKVIGLDLTPAMIEKAREEAASAGLANIEFRLGDALSLPLAADSADVVVCGYSIHHMPEATRVIGEMARVLRVGGRLGIVDLMVEEGADADLNNAIERARDGSHTVKITRAQLETLAQAAGLRQLKEEWSERRFDFKDWMHVAGHEPGDADYIKVQRMMEEPLQGGAAGFKPHPSPNSGALKFMNTSVLWVGEKVR